jgi:hypothetical protein
MTKAFEYPDHCPIAADLREALASGLEGMEIDDIKELLVYAAETLERQHEYLRFIHTTMKGGMAPGNA